MSRTFGKVECAGKRWNLATPWRDVMRRLKQIFPGISKEDFEKGKTSLRMTTEVAADLKWFFSRYPFEIGGGDELILNGMAKRHVEEGERLEDIIRGKFVPRGYDLEVTPRDYQKTAAEWWNTRRRGLLGDEIGLGKTISAIAGFSGGEFLPILVVVQPHLKEQWAKEVRRCVPAYGVHVIYGTNIKPIPAIDGRQPDVFVIGYNLLNKWGPFFQGKVKGIIFDECQELRRSGASSSEGDWSNKYRESHALARTVEFCLGMSGTPIFNYGGEMFNVLDVLTPGVLGSKEEFVATWGEGTHANNLSQVSLKDPEDFGSWLRSNHIMLRRTRKEVGRELQKLQIINHTIPFDEAELNRVEDMAVKLATRLLSEQESQPGEMMRVAQELSNTLRMATGIAKAPHVAQFVQMMVENGEPCVLFGWHKMFYKLIKEYFDKHSIRHAFYTGGVSSSDKQEAVRDFIDEKIDVLVVSLRSGAGLDGLQHRSRTAIIGELDWSPAVHDQNIGRVLRDGQGQQVAAYYLVADGGMDPLLTEKLGIKTEQVDGIRADADGVKSVAERPTKDFMREIARRYLERVGKFPKRLQEIETAGSVIRVRDAAPIVRRVRDAG